MQLYMPVIRHKNKKPQSREEVLDHFKTQDSHEIAIIGDRVFTDVLMGSKAGFFTILTEPLDEQADSYFVRIARWFENDLITAWKQTMEPPIHPTIPAEQYESIRKSSG